MNCRNLIFVLVILGTWSADDIATFANAKKGEGNNVADEGSSHGGVGGFTTLTTKMFRNEALVASHHTVTYPTNKDKKERGAVESKSDASAKSLASDLEEEIGDSDDDDDEYDPIRSGGVLHQPSGQHMLVDIKHVDANFLYSETRLAQALIDLVQAAKAALLSYHCYSLLPRGISCVGILLESHVAIHTWPQEGAIMMDLFTCDDNDLIPLLPTIKRLFAIPSKNNLLGETDNEMLEPRMLWSHKRRGFREGFDPDYDRGEHPLDQEMGQDAFRKHDLDMKEPLVSEETEFQQVDVLEVIDPWLRSLGSYERSLSDDGSYESLHPEFYKPDKHLFLQGTLQSTLYGEAEYHEALVHPAMIAHPNPKRVAIIGGGEGATLREVLKHKTVEEVLMVEIDGELVELCREYLPEWSNCTDIVGSDADSCFDDSRASVVFEDAFAWFLDEFGTQGECVKDCTGEKAFDVIIMDCLDPEKMVEIAGDLYRDDHFVNSLFRGLSENGVFVVQLGESEKSTDPSIDSGRAKDKAHMIEALEKIGFKSMHIYDEGHAHYQAPWSMLVAFKAYKTRANWYKSAAMIEIELHKRLHHTKSGKPALRFFDGPTMLSYQVPPKALEITYCRVEDTPWECGIDPNAMRWKRAEDDSMLEHVQNQFAEDFHIFPLTLSVMNDLENKINDFNAEIVFDDGRLSSVVMFAGAYGYSSTLLGKKNIDISLANLCNDGNNTSMYRNGGMGVIEPYAYSPVLDRHLRQVRAVASPHSLCAGGMNATEDINKE